MPEMTSDDLAKVLGTPARPPAGPEFQNPADPAQSQSQGPRPDGSIGYSYQPPTPLPPTEPPPTAAPPTAEPPPPPPPPTAAPAPPPDIQKDLGRKTSPAPVPGTPTEPGGPPKPPSMTDMGADALPRVAWAVDGVESGHKHTEDDGSIKKSGKGAVGRMGLLPGSFPGVNVNDEQTNLAKGKEYLAEQYKKYGNWNDALVAYNWGPGNADKWIEQGRPYDKLPQETRDYLVKVAQGLGATPGVSFGTKKDKLTGGDISEIFREDDKREGRVPHEEGEEVKPAEDQPYGFITPDGYPAEMGPEQKEQLDALGFGAYTGLRDLLAGPVQAGLEKTSPGTAKEFTDWINRMDAPYADVVAKHPYMNTAGNIIGTGIGILGAGRLLGAAVGITRIGTTLGPAIQQAIQRVPGIIRYATGGSILGGLTFNPDPESASRVGEAVLGGAGGTLGYSIGKALGSALKYASDTAIYKRFVQELRKTAENLSADAAKVKDAFADHYERISKIKNDKYTVRNAAGDRIDGYPTGLETQDGVSELIERAKGGKILEGGREVRATQQAESLARRLDDTLGLKAQRREMDEHLEKVKAWEENRAKTDDIMVGGRKLKDFPAGDRAALESKLRAQNVMPESPPHPGDFQSKPISAQQYADARREIETTLRRKGLTPQAKFQIRELKRQLEAEASKTARDAGMDVTTFERKMRAADKFNKEVFAPAQKVAKDQTAAELRSPDKMTNADMYNQVIDAVRGNDREAQETLFKALGPKGRRQAALAVQHDMFDNAVSGIDKRFDPARLSKYVEDHEGGLRQLLGRDEFTRLQGVAKIAERLGKEAQRDPAGFTFHHKWALALTGMEMLTGHGSRAALWGSYVVGANILENAARHIKLNPRLDILLPKAARLNPDSREMDQIVKQVGRVMGRSGQIGGREAGQGSMGLPSVGGVVVEEVQGVFR